MYLRRLCDTKLFLWFLFLVQLLLIGVFILFGSVIINSTTNDGLAANQSVKFVPSGKNFKETFTPKNVGTHLKISQIGNFSEFYRVGVLPKNGSAPSERLCYKHGSQNQVRRNRKLFRRKKF
jgi:hypothetical protein